MLFNIINNNNAYVNHDFFQLYKLFFSSFLQNKHVSRVAIQTHSDIEYTYSYFFQVVRTLTHSYCPWSQIDHTSNLAE